MVSIGFVNRRLLVRVRPGAPITSMLATKVSGLLSTGVPRPHLLCALIVTGRQTTSRRGAPITGGFHMRSDIVPGAVFPDYELSDHSAKHRKLSELQGQHPMVLVLSCGRILTPPGSVNKRATTPRLSSQ